MHYINDSNTKAIKYDDLVDLAIASGIDVKRAYLYLAGMGIRGELTRIVSSDLNGYHKPVKIAMRDEKTFLTKAVICKSCGNLKVS